MKALVVGGAGSGKSAFAEGLACQLSQTRTYIATMASNGSEARARIRRHREQRAGLGFSTIECDGSLEPALGGARRGGVVLLDDLGNLLANALFLPDGTMADPTETLELLVGEVVRLYDAFDHVVVVGNDVGRDGPSPYASTATWVRLMGSLCCELASRSDTVAEVVAGLPCVVKGELP